MPFTGYLKQSTAVDIILGPFVDEDDGKTAETGLTIAQADVRLSKNGANIAQKNDATSCSHDELGMYKCDLDATDTNTLGLLDVMVHESGALPVKQTYQVVTAHWYDTMCSTDYLQVDAIQIEGSDATDQINAACDTAIETYGLDHLISASVAGADVANDSIIAQMVGDDATADWDTFDNTTDSLEALRNHIGDGTNLTEAGGTGDQLTAVPWNSSWDAEVQSECTDALNAYDPPTDAEMDAGFAGLNDPTAAGIADAVWDEAASGHTSAGSFGQQLGTDVDAILADTNELQSDDVPGLIAGLNDPTAASIADAVWDEAASGHTSAGSFGQQLGTDVDAILADTNELQSDDVPGLISALNDPTAAAVADAVWDEAASGHTSAGSFGAQCGTDIDAILADTNELQTDDVPTLISGLNDPTAAAVADAVWDEAASGHTSAGSFGVQCGTDIDAILTDTAEIGAAGAGLTALPWNSSWDAEVQSECADALNAYDPPTDAEMDAGFAGLNDPTAAAVADAVWDEATSGHTSAGSFGKTVQDISSSGIADAVWDEATSGHTSAGSFGKTVQDISSSGIADAVWDEAASGHTSAGSFGAQLGTDVDAILVDTNELQTDDIPSKIAALNDPTAAAIADAVWDEAASGHDTEDTFGNIVNDLTEEASGTYRFTTAALAQAPTGSAGSGAETFTYTLTDADSGAPIVDADVWVTSDQAGNSVVASGSTDSNGQVVFYLDTGTVYVWRQKPGYNFTNPDTETVS